MSGEDDKSADPELTISEEEVDGDEEDRPTVAPPFDPVEFAKEVLGRPSPVAGTPAVVSESAKMNHRPTPAGGALAFANSQIPSVAPAKSDSEPVVIEKMPVPGKESTASLAAVDREWEDLELSTRPPPPNVQTDSDLPTRPPPPGLMDSLDAMPSTRDAKALQPAEPMPHVASDPPPPSQGPPTEQEMNDRVSLGDYTGALDIAERLLVIDPENQAANSCAEISRTVLKQMYTARVGPLDRVPTVAVARDQLRWLSIDHRAGFVLSLIDGVSSIEMILDVSGMPELDALRILSELVQQRIISFR